jgi:tight adherence protein C
MSLLFLALILVVAIASVRLILGASARRRSAQLVDAAVQSAFPAPVNDREGSWVVNWLSRAGFRDPSAFSIFLGATLGLTALGLLGMYLMSRLGVVSTMLRALSVLPVGVVDLFSFVAMAGPYIVLVILASAPALLVRAARRSRLEAIEQDLAPTLELLATLAEAGLGFDSAIARIQESESGQRPLNQEFRIYQRDTLGGIPRLESLRRFARRIDVTSVSIFVSALVQAEQVGASLAETLRSQADELRDRRKMRALLLAQALPVKLVFPLILCFLPGIFYSVLGPVISQFVEVADSVIRRR